MQAPQEFNNRRPGGEGEIMTGKSNGWIGVDLDGTLATYDGWHGADHIGEPVWSMVERVRQWRAQGIEVRIFTARVYKYDDEAKRIAGIISDWCAKNIGERLPITAAKDYAMIELWDDRAVRVIANTGIRADDVRGRLDHMWAEIAEIKAGIAALKQEAAP